MSGPNPLRAAWSILWARRVSSPNRFGTATVDHSLLKPALDELTVRGTAGLVALEPDLAAYCAHLEDFDPNHLTRQEALAFWLNLYNAAALRLASRAQREGMDSVLRVPGGFDRTTIEINGESLSLNDIEHGKIRRFQDPRIHAALVCGAVSCPTLRSEPYTGGAVDTQLDDQMKSFLAAGAARYEGGALVLSRVFLWYGSDFVRPARMPTWLPAGRKRVAAALRHWYSTELQLSLPEGDLAIRFQSYDWGLGCAVA